MSATDGASSKPLILIRGAGATSSGVAYRLFKAGCWVVMTELEHPLLARTTVSYGACVYYWTVVIEGIVARKTALNAEKISENLASNTIPVVIDPDGKLIDLLHPLVVVDARMAETKLDTKISDARLVIALGSGFTAGEDCHAVIETNPGHLLGRVLWHGKSESVPAPAPSECILRAPIDGILAQFVQVGEFVRQGTRIARVGDAPIVAPFDGVLRGLLDYDSHVLAGARLGYFDSHVERKHCFTISGTALAVGGGVVEAALSSGII